MPIVVHSRSAGKYAIKILTEEGAKRVIMHAFDGSVGYAIEGVKKGFYFSIPPSIVRSEQKQKMAKHLPLDKILLESDAPVLGPTKDIINTPSNIVISAAKIAEIKKIPINEVINATTKNAQEIFNFK
jgi:Mg-dependent DNase